MGMISVASIRWRPPRPSGSRLFSLAGASCIHTVKRALAPHRLKAFGTVRQRCLLINAHRCQSAPRFVEEGCGRHHDKPRPGRERKLDGKQEARLVAITSSPPEGHVNWTLHLLADKVVELEFAGSISLETVRQILKKTNQVAEKANGASPS